MKVNAFKQLIKEAAKQGVMEAFLEITQDQKQPIKENFSFKSNDVPATADVRRALAQKMGAIFSGDETGSKNLAPVAGDNPYLAFLQDTAANLSPQDRAGIGNLGETY